MKTSRRSLGYGAYGQNPFAPNFIVCKSEGGTADCPSEYVKEFSGLDDSGKYANIMAVVAIIAFLGLLTSFGR